MGGGFEKGMGENQGKSRGTNDKMLAAIAS